MSGSKGKSSSDVTATVLTVPFKVLYHKIKNIFFNFLCLFCKYYLCEKYYKPITVQYYVASFVSGYVG